MSASQVLNASTYYTTLDPNFCNQCKPRKLIALNLLLKTFTQLVDAIKAGLPQTHLIRSGRNDSIQRSPHPWRRLSLKFRIFICNRNSNTC